MSLQFRRGLDADRTSITPLAGEPLWITDTSALYVGDGSTAGGVQITGGAGAPTNATYITQTSNGTLTNEQALASLATGILKNTTSTGVLSIAVGADLPSHTHTLADITDDGTMAAQNANNVAITGGSLAGVTVTTGTYSSNVNEAVLQPARKETSGTITKGQVVRITNSSGTHLQVELADASAESTATGTIGVAATDITSTTTGYVMVNGELTGLSNVPTSSFTNGQALWLSETTGEFTATRPTQPAHGVFLGWVVNASSGSSGRIYVKVINGQELNELHDVLILGVADNHFLVYDNATSLWKNESPSDARTSLGLGSVATESTVPISKGGTGQTSQTNAFDALSPTTTKGDIIAHNGTDNVRLAVGGTDGHVLTVDSSTATGLKWSAAAGGVSDGDKGDITVSSSGATWTVDNQAITYAKIQDVSATDKILGRSTAGSGTVEEITCTAAGRAILDDVDAAAQRTTLGAAAATHTHAVGDLTAGSASSGQVLTYNGTAWAPATPSGGGTKTYAFFTPLDAQPPASNFATLDTRNSIAVLEFDGGATDESTTFVGIMPEAASLGSGLKVRIHWMADTATSGNVRWGVQFQRLTDDVDAAAYDTAVEGNSAAPTGTGADGTPAVLELTVTTIDSIAAGDAYRLKVYREASDTTNDTMSGDAQLIAVEVRSAA